MQPALSNIQTAQFACWNAQNQTRKKLNPSLKSKNQPEPTAQKNFPCKEGEGGSTTPSPPYHAPDYHQANNPTDHTQIAYSAKSDYTTEKWNKTTWSSARWPDKRQRVESKNACVNFKPEKSATLKTTWF
jgi:hypothetical protein